MCRGEHLLGEFTALEFAGQSAFAQLQNAVAQRQQLGEFAGRNDNPQTVVQTEMRHSAITLTMNTYGHLFAGQDADAVARMRGIMLPPSEALKATGTDDPTVEAPDNAQVAMDGEPMRRAAMTGRRTRRKMNRPSP